MVATLVYSNHYKAKSGLRLLSQEGICRSGWRSIDLGYPHTELPNERNNRISSWSRMYLHCSSLDGHPLRQIHSILLLKMRDKAICISEWLADLVNCTVFISFLFALPLSFISKSCQKESAILWKSWLAERIAANFIDNGQSVLCLSS